MQWEARERGEEPIEDTKEDPPRTPTTDPVALAPNSQQGKSRTSSVVPTPSTKRMEDYATPMTTRKHMSDQPQSSRTKIDQRQEFLSGQSVEVSRSPLEDAEERLDRLLKESRETPKTGPRSNRKEAEDHQKKAEEIQEAADPQRTLMLRDDDHEDAPLWNSRQPEFAEEREEVKPLFTEQIREMKSRGMRRPRWWTRSRTTTKR